MTSKPIAFAVSLWVVSLIAVPALGQTPSPPPAPSSAATTAPPVAPPAPPKPNPDCINPRSDSATGFSYCAPADLIPRSIKSDGSAATFPAYGRYDTTKDAQTVHHLGMDPEMDWSDAVAKMCFPIDSLAFANSLVYNPGGDHYPDAKKPKGGQSDKLNFAYPWRDNFCESRGKSRKNTSCNVGHGHQGQDIRPEKPVKVTYTAIAPEDATVVSVPGSDGKGFTVTLLGKSAPYRKYRYLHLEEVSVSTAKPYIRAGDPIGKVSDYFGWHWEPQYVKTGKTFAKDANGKKIPLYVKDADGTDHLDAKGKKVQVQTKVYDHTLIHLHFEIYLSQQETVDGVTYKAGTYVSPYMALANAYGRKLALAPGVADTACRTQ